MSRYLFPKIQKEVCRRRLASSRPAFYPKKELSSFSLLRLNLESGFEQLFTQGMNECVLVFAGNRTTDK